MSLVSAPTREQQRAPPIRLSSSDHPGGVGKGTRTCFGQTDRWEGVSLNLPVFKPCPDYMGARRHRQDLMAREPSSSPQGHHGQVAGRTWARPAPPPTHTLPLLTAWTGRPAQGNPDRLPGSGMQPPVSGGSALREASTPHVLRLCLPLGWPPPSPMLPTRRQQQCPAERVRGLAAPVRLCRRETPGAQVRASDRGFPACSDGAREPWVHRGPHLAAEHKAKAFK